MSSVTTAKEACPSCGTVPRSPLLCEHCQELLEPLVPPGPFEALGLTPTFALDLGDARRRMLEFSRALHPDFHATAGPEERRRAEDNTAALNAAFRVLSDDSRRADWLLRFLGGPPEEEERSMPREFLEEVLEWNETIEQARADGPGSPTRQALEELGRRLEAERARAMDGMGALLTPLPAHGSPLLGRARQQLNAVRYLDRALGELGELRLTTGT